MKTTNTNIHYPFWKLTEKGGVTLSISKLVKFLAKEGFGNFQTVEGRTQGKTLFFNNDGVLELHEPDSVKGWLTGYIESCKTTNDIEKEDVQDKIVKIAPSTLNNYLQALPIFSEEEFNDTIKLDIFRDDKENCYIPFKNGVVHISSNDIKLIPLENLTEKGNIWESSIIRKKIEILDQYMVTQSNYFRDFVTYALKKDILPVKGKNDIKLGTDNDRFNETLEAFETGFGFLIHSYQPSDEQKVVVFIDVESSPDRTEGRNGKSLCMEQLKNYRNTAFVNGKQFRKSMSESSRFNFSNVKIDTGFVFINDLNPDFDLTTMFSDITDEMTVEGKGTNKLVISKDKKPKMGITTNYIITGVGSSFEERQHIVEFGNFWNKASKFGIKPKTILGKKIGDDFDENDWIKYYNYGFQCIQKYLMKGLSKQNLANYNKKNLIASIEGINGNGQIVDWMEDWISTTRLEGNYQIDGISIDKLYTQFQRDNILESTTQGWDKFKLLDGFFDFIKTKQEYDWNPHKSDKGSTRASRRWRVGPKGEQVDYVKITSVND